MSVLSRPYFHDEAAAFEHVEGMLWPQGPVCRHCGSMEKHYALKGGRTKASKKNPHGLEIHGLYKCSDCRKKFTVRMGTIFEESKLPMTKPPHLSMSRACFGRRVRCAVIAAQWKSTTP